MNDNTNNRLKNFLIYGPQVPLPRESPEPETVITEETSMEQAEMPVREEVPVQEPEAPAFDGAALESLESQLAEIRGMLEELGSRPTVPDLTPYMTTREQQKALSATISKIETSSSNKSLVKAMEQISTMREDFLRLCKDMRPRISDMDPEMVLSSFEAYCVDMENILTDVGVYIGRFEFDKLNTLHQRIVGVVPTGEKEKDGTIAERQSDGYKLGDKVLLKERVSVYKYDPSFGTPDAPEVETPSETAETASETSCNGGDGPEGSPVTTEEKE